MTASYSTYFTAFVTGVHETLYTPSVLVVLVPLFVTIVGVPGAAGGVSFGIVTCTLTGATGAVQLPLLLQPATW